MNFKNLTIIIWKNFRLRGSNEPLPCNKTPAELDEIIFVHQEQATNISDYGKSTDSSLSDGESDEDNNSVPKEVTNNAPEILNLQSMNNLKVVQLKELLRERNLRVSGNKRELVDRLQKHRNESNKESTSTSELA